MANVVEFDFVDSKSGKITYTAPASYVAATGASNCQTGQNVSTSTKWRAFFNFDTSSLPDTALVSKVEFLIRTSSSQPSGAPEVYVLRFSIGTFIGAALNGNSGEFNGGTLMVTLGAKPADSTWLDLDQDANNPEPYVNLTGDTDLKVWDDSSRGTGDSSWGLNFNGKGKCRLRVTYTVPSGTATGRGTASVLARVIVAGRATATGKGTVQASATVRAAGASTATGRGTARLAAFVAAVSSGTATGRGIAEATATITASGSSSATGRGTIELTVTVVTPGSSTASGRGISEATATVIVAASATATGCGAVICVGEVETPAGGPSSTATGRGFVLCLSLVEYPTPMALHFAARTIGRAHADRVSVSPVHRASEVLEFAHSGARSVSPFHHAACVCMPNDAATRGARRMTDV